MRMFFVSATVLVCAWLSSSAHAGLATAYQFVDLTPPGFTRGVVLAGSGSAQVGQGRTPAGAYHALLWHGTAASVVDLHPASGFQSSTAGDVSGDTQVGWAALAANPNVSHALMWHGSAASVVDMNPVGAVGSAMASIGGDQQVGNVYTGNTYHAALWHGSPSGVVNLNPAWAGLSFGNGTDGVSQVGTAYGAVGAPQAVLWHGTAASAVNLTPAGAWGSVGQSVRGSQQVGTLFPQEGQPFHAALWSGSAESLIDLHPAGFTISEATDLNGSIQVGSAGAPGGRHAIAWAGSASAYVDLQQFVTGGLSQSEAWGVTDDGIILGRATGADSQDRMVMWIPVPEPTSVSMIALVMVRPFSRARRARSSRERQGGR